MEVIIRNISDLPIYQQIYDQIKKQILLGKLEAGSPLPSIRSLAKDLKISVITTKRAYDELEKDGYIVTVASKGCFVSENNLELLKEKQLLDLKLHIQKVKEIASDCQISDEELIKMLKGE